jgi:hypothetical protein
LVQRQPQLFAIAGRGKIKAEAAEQDLVALGHGSFRELL